MTDTLTIVEYTNNYLNHNFIYKVYYWDCEKCGIKAKLHLDNDSYTISCAYCINTNKLLTISCEEGQIKKLLE